MTDVTTIMEIVIGVVGVIAAVLVVPAFAKRYGIDALRKAAEFACYAAEEAARTGLIQKREKFEYAAMLIKKSLGIFSLTVDETKIRAAIDATCHYLFNQFKDDAEQPREGEE